jgi:hypothetical protein
MFSETWAINIGGETAVYSLNSSIPRELAVISNRNNQPLSLQVAIPEGSQVNLILFNPGNGRSITLLNQYLNAGWYRIEYPGNTGFNGVFLYRIKAGSRVKTGKVLVVR